MILPGLFFNRLRGCLILFAGVALVLYSSVCSSFVLDIDFAHPADIKNIKDRENERASERINTEDEKEGDREKADAYDRDHML